jgi:hypothetical protein
MGRAIQPFTLLNSVKVRVETLRFWPEQTAPVSAEMRFSRTGNQDTQIRPRPCT